MLRRGIKYGLIGALGIGTVNTAVKLHKENYDINSLAFVRTGRSAITVFEIGWLYKRKLYAKNLDKNTEEYKNLKSEVHQQAANKLLQLCRRNKGVFVKVGQHIGAMDYILPLEYVETMRILHKDAPINPLNMIFQVIREDLNIEPTELFDDFEPEPLGAASLAQVHKAKLKDGTEVAVKVQHSFVRRNIDVDVRCMEYLTKAMSWVFPDFQIDWLIKLTKKNLYKELDFKHEAGNAEKLAWLFKSYKWLKIPKVYWDYTTERVLVMELVQGGLVNDINYIKKHKIDPYDLSKKLGDLYSHMIFVHGFVHGDPHSGNIIVKKSPNDKDVTIYLLDHGLYGTLTDQFRYDYSQLWLSIIHRDFKKMKVYAKKLGIDENLYFLFACMVTGRPWETIKNGIGSTKPGQTEKELFQKQVPNLIFDVSHCLENMDPQTLIVLKTNDLVRSIEYMLGTQERMCGFTTMSKCCLQTANEERYRNSTSTIDRMCVRLKSFYTMLAFYIFTFFTETRSKFL